MGSTSYDSAGASTIATVTGTLHLGIKLIRSVGNVPIEIVPISIAVEWILLNCTYIGAKRIPYLSVTRV